jgi:predicted ATP-grasp superfamily ATP-dependent carboligase
LLKKNFQYPIVVKPRKGFGAIGFHKIDDENQLKVLCDALKNDVSSYVFQEYIPQTDIQYKIAIFIDELNEIKSACVYAKNRWFPIDGGSSTCNVTVDRPDIVETCTKLLKTMEWRGAADIDLIQDPRDGVAKVMDFNPRISGSVKIAFEAGVDIARQILQLAFDEPVVQCTTYKKNVCLRCIHTDLLWFLKSENRFKTNPSWFSWKNTSDQIWSWRDPLPFFTFSLQAIMKYKREMKKRAR